ncbi:11406_t:CDS:1, partial [Racocetra fulgida]
SWVWDYFLIEKNNDICKIIRFFKENKKECDQKYKYDGGTKNMAYYLQTYHKIFDKNIFDDELTL